MPYDLGNVMTLADLASRHGGRDNKVLPIVEMLTKMSPLLQDMSWQEGNLATGHVFPVRVGLPGVHWRRINQGVRPTKSTVTQVTETCGMLEAVSEIDEKLVQLANDPAQFRLTESMAFMEAMTQEFEAALWYGNGQLKPETMTGFAPRFSLLTGPVKNQIIDAGGTGNNNASIWLIVWNALTAFGIYPKGMPQGLKHHASSIIDLIDADGGTFRGYRDRFQWNVGLCLRDPRYIVRIANIDVDKLSTYGTSSDQSADLMSLMNIATNRIHNIGMGRAVFYMNRTVREAWENQMLKNYHIQHTKETATGKWEEAYKMIPIRICDSLLNTEERVI